MPVVLPFLPLIAEVAATVVVEKGAESIINAGKPPPGAAGAPATSEEESVIG